MKENDKIIVKKFFRWEGNDFTIGMKGTIVKINNNRSSYCVRWEKWDKGHSGNDKNIAFNLKYSKSHYWIGQHEIAIGCSIDEIQLDLFGE